MLVPLIVPPLPQRNHLGHKLLLPTKNKTDIWQFLLHWKFHPIYEKRKGNSHNGQLAYHCDHKFVTARARIEKGLKFFIKYKFFDIYFFMNYQIEIGFGLVFLRLHHIKDKIFSRVGLTSTRFKIFGACTRARPSCCLILL